MPEARQGRGDTLREVEGVPYSENLALLYQGLLTGVVRIRSGEQTVQDADAFRRRTKAALQEVERFAAAAGYDVSDVKETHFAVAALLDSVILHSTDPVRAEWQRKTLQEELFGQTDAGVVFFEKLDRLLSRRDSKQLADVLEVYALCLLLGFEGRYSGGLRGELDANIERVRSRIETIRGRSQRLSPAGELPGELKPAAGGEPRRSRRFEIVTLALLVFTILCYLVLRLHLAWTSRQLDGTF
jgi:type VI secretion system protein ImpK